MQEASEAELVARCRSGDARAWEDFFERYYPAVGRFVFQLSPEFSREDAEDIAQEVFLSALKNLSSFRGSSQVQTWLFRIALNKARDYRERLSAAKRGGGRAPLSLQAGDPETGLAIDPPSPGPAPDAGVLDDERSAILRKAIDGLGVACREIIELRYFGDLSYEELAVELRLHPKTVSSRLSKCLDRLETRARELFSPETSAEFPV